MARLRYADLYSPDIEPLVDQIIAERGSVRHLYQMLSHSHPAAPGWLNHLTGIRQNTTISGALQETAITRMAHLDRAPCSPIPTP